MIEKFPDVVILLPGITGSELVKDGRVIWGWSGGVLLRNLISAGRALREDLSLATDSPDSAVLDDGVRATRTLPDLHLLPGVWKVDGYGAIRQYLQRALGIRDGENFFEFPYDWRRDNRAAAYRLSQDAPRWLAAWRRQSGHDAAKLILVGHSMGGLIARYFLEVLGGWQDTRALITFGTPFAGSINAVDSLINGVEKFGIQLTDVLRGFNSLYQLLPTYACCDTGSGSLQPLRQVNLPDLDAKRLATAVAFHSDIRSAAARNAEDATYRQLRYRTFPIVGYNQPTRQSFKLVDARIELLETLGGATPGGDGTVPRQSAVPESYDLPSAMFASTKHASLQNSTAALTHLGGVISSLYLPAPFRGPAVELPVQVSLAVEDIYWSPTPVIVRAKPSTEVELLRINFFESSTDRPVSTGTMQPEADGWHGYRFAPPAGGSYRVVVTGKQGVVEPAGDVFEFVHRGAIAA